MISTHVHPQVLNTDDPKVAAHMDAISFLPKELRENELQKLKEKTGTISGDAPTIVEPVVASPPINSSNVRLCNCQEKKEKERRIPRLIALILSLSKRPT
jgi:hypothetical protein